MFEAKTFENILGEMLSNVSSIDPDLDTRTGSIIYNALAPIALELETVYHEMDMILDETFLDTASKEYLLQHGSQLGLDINEATYGHFKGEFNVDLEIGSRFNLDKFNYNVIEKLADPSENNPYYIFELVCETAGSEPNSYLGDLTPITYISDLTYAKLTSILIYGEDEEETEAYRYRLQVHVKKPPVNGNVSQYEEWLSEYDGIGKYKVVPCWNGINTVKLIVLNAENKAASDELIAEVQEYFDPVTATINDTISDPSYPQGRGVGNGQAPIGAIITVDTINETPLVIKCELELNNNYTSTTTVENEVNDYLNSIVMNNSVIAYMPIAAIIYNSPCVKTVKKLSITVNGTVMDTSVTPFVQSVTLNDNQIAVLDTQNSVWSV
jgi:uncharacterized phage protein gp47/JayE